MRFFFLIVFGALGTLARYGLQGVVQTRMGTGFPGGTLAINILGCFLVGAIGQYSLSHLTIPPEWRIGLTIGFLGAFTTFSPFGWETVHMLQDGEWMKSIFYVLGSVLGSLLAAMIGIRLGNAL